MQHDVPLSRENVGSVIYSAAAMSGFCGPHPLPWAEIAELDRGRWRDVGDGVLKSLSLGAVAAGIRAEREALTDALGAGVVEVDGEKFMRDARRNLMACGTIKPQRQLEDELVRKVMFYARDLSDQIRRFKGHTFEDLAAFQSLLEQQYGVPPSDGKGNCSYTSFDDTLKVEVKIADQIAFGPELQAAKRLVDECLKEWGADSHEALRSLVNRVFSVEKEGQINRGELFSMLAMEIADERWQRAMEAIRDSIRVIGTKAYLRFRFRDADGAWSTVSLNVASA